MIYHKKCPYCGKQHLITKSRIEIFNDVSYFVCEHCQSKIIINTKIPKKRQTDIYNYHLN